MKTYPIKRFSDIAQASGWIGLGWINPPNSHRDPQVDSESKPDWELSAGLEWREMHAAFMEGGGCREKMNAWGHCILQASGKGMPGHENGPDTHGFLCYCHLAGTK